MHSSRVPVVVVLDNVRSLYNVGAIFRTCEAFGVSELVLTGITPHPRLSVDPRPDYVIARAEKEIKKTALEAFGVLPWSYREDVQSAVFNFKKKGYRIVGVEQTDRSISLDQAMTPGPVCLIFGHEREGINKTVLDLCDEIVSIPMKGAVSSFNVSVCVGIVLYAFQAGSEGFV